MELLKILFCEIWKYKRIVINISDQERLSER